MKSVSATNKLTGEVYEVTTKTPEDILMALREIRETISAWERIKKDVQQLAYEIVDEAGRFEHDGWIIKTTSVQRMNYTKAALREVFDEDEIDLFLEPRKSAIDSYIKDHLAELGDKSTQLRQSMVPVGKPYGMVKVERVG